MTVTSDAMPSESAAVYNWPEDITATPLDGHELPNLCKTASDVEKECTIDKHDLVHWKPLYHATGRTMPANLLPKPSQSTIEYSFSLANKASSNELILAFGPRGVYIIKAIPCDDTAQVGAITGTPVYTRAVHQLKETEPKSVEAVIEMEEFAREDGILLESTAFSGREADIYIIFDMPDGALQEIEDLVWCKLGYGHHSTTWALSSIFKESGFSLKGPGYADVFQDLRRSLPSEFLDILTSGQVHFNGAHLLPKMYCKSHIGFDGYARTLKRGQEDSIIAAYKHIQDRTFARYERSENRKKLERNDYPKKKLGEA
jgi:hypothetical protein